MHYKYGNFEQNINQINVFVTIQLRSSERQALVGPPESMREHVVAASKAMRNGDWKKCRDLIINDKMNGKVTIEISLLKVLCTM